MKSQRKYSILLLLKNPIYKTFFKKSFYQKKKMYLYNVQYYNHFTHVNTKPTIDP